MAIELVPIKQTERPVLEALMLAYFKEIDPAKIITENGREYIDYPYLASYWTDEKRIPYFIHHDQQPVGFVLINDWIVEKEFSAKRSIAEFYVIPPFRRGGIGQEVVQTLFSKLSGKWEVRQSEKNTTAVSFWRSVIDRFTDGIFTEVSHHDAGETEIIQLFTA